MGAIVFLLCGTFLTVAVSFSSRQASQQLRSTIVKGFEGKVRHDFYRQRTNGSVLYCQMLCLRDEECMSFFYNRNTVMCQTHGVVFFNSDDCQPSSGSQYYTQVQDFCPHWLGYIYNRALRFCYKLHYREPRSPKDAIVVCQKEGGDLVVTDTEEKYNHIGWTIGASTFDLPANVWPGFLIGATEAVTTDKRNWKWPDGQKVDESIWKWCPGEPNDPDCQHNVVIDGSYHPACVNDVYIDAKHFVCERQT